ncbi:hypothetical protein COV49_00820 [Candidatus Falkowbacteria bacterium CG11_big_fil_rev_8_21_14_0_20_39_10]|uniref:DAGKc domain-containing protein n=1 Tax=Candidatus Falkowbacteria bacterium CG11_big_fil_rev_8_21_14_0_20_39_10 TaxID=1974570 RepID=A0A2M6K9Y6_9BACT|nr:MAG: hypothetical protein COV49_00820 [Candidatus Falkowbacteria bacterium CG11_big_fil_rev_8_21_14_0_20_39_10]
MHVYIYDDFVNKKKYDKLLAQVEIRVTDLGLGGKIIRLDVMKNIQEAVAGEIKRGAKTIIAVGNDQTVSKIINVMASLKSGQLYGTKTCLAVIPVGESDNLIARALGINDSEDACNTLSSRRIEEVYLGQVQSDSQGGQKGFAYFLTQAKIKSQGTTLDINKDCSLEIMESGQIQVINLSVFEQLPENIQASPQDKTLELFIETKKSSFNIKPALNQSFFSIKKLTVLNPKAPLLLDNSLAVPTPAEITVAEKKLSIIVGKGRRF